jgi:hypothetical protein
MKILFVSFGILPSQGGAGQVAESLASGFTKDEMCVVGEQVIFLGRIKRAADLPNYYYVRSNLSYKGKGKRFLNYIRWIVLFPYLLWKMQRIFKKEKCDYVLGTFPDNFYLFAAYLIAKWNKAGFSSYFHNTYLENRRRGLTYSTAKYIQPRVFACSDWIFVMSEGMQRRYEHIYPEYKDKFRPLLHTFESYPARPEKDLSVKKDRYDLVLIGNFNASNVEATGRLVRALGKDPRYRIKMFTHVPKILLKSRGIDIDSIDYRGYVRQEDFYKALMDNDICILTHGFTGAYSPTEYETIFPTRTIPLLISGLPIFAHSPAGSFLNYFIKKYDCAELIEEADEEMIRTKMAALIDNPDRKSELVMNALKAAEIFYVPNVVSFLKKKLSEKMQA